MPRDRSVSRAACPLATGWLVTRPARRC